MNSVLKEVLSLAIILTAMGGIAVGRLPLLTMNRATMATVAAVLLVALGAIPVKEALDAIDLGTIVLLFAMMIIVASLRLSGFFSLVSSRLARLVDNPSLFLVAVVTVSGLLSALFLNDTICLVLTPIVTAACLYARRNPIPFLIATACAANIGSAATIIGNPQNMLIGARSGIGFLHFVVKLAPPSLIGLGVCVIVIRLAFAKDFYKIPLSEKLSIPLPRLARTEARPIAPAAERRHGHRIFKPLLIKSLVASAIMLVGFLSGIPVVLAAALPSAMLLITRRIKPSRILREVDYSLLVFFAGLFIITEAASRTLSFGWLEQNLLAHAAGSPWLWSGATALVSNIISNVPAVMVLSPLTAASPDPTALWLMLAMASTYAGNLTLVGSVANLIVAEGAQAQGVKLSFGAYLKAGVPITLITLAIGTWWLG